MCSVKALVFLLGAVLIFMEFQKASAASLFEDHDEDDIVEDSDDFDLDEIDAASKLMDDLNYDVKEKRGCANYASRIFCEKTKSWCARSNQKGRLIKRKCKFTCGRCHG